jgi:hypothetical protein
MTPEGGSRTAAILKRRWPLVLLLILVAAWLLRPGGAVPPAAPRPAESARADRESPPDEGRLSLPNPAAPPDEPSPAEARPAERGGGGADAGPDAVLAGLLWLLKTQNPDGSWGPPEAVLEGHPIDRVGTTALALLAFLGAGYSHLSKDTHDGLSMGDAVRGALEWLMKNQGAAGVFPTSGDPALGQMLGALALGEAYGLTGSRLFKDPAQAAFGAFAAMQKADGSWGDLNQTAWAAEALRSAEASGLDLPREPFAKAAAWFRAQLDRGPNLPAMVGHILVNTDKEHPSLAATTLAVANTPAQWSQQSFAYWYLGSMALFQYDGPQGPQWRQWSESLKETLVRTQQPDGTWPGSGPGDVHVRTCLGQLTLQVYYRYANVLGK